MTSLAPPVARVADVVPVCVANMQNMNLQQRLAGVIPDLQAAETIYIAAGPAATLFQIVGTISVGGTVTTAEMVSLYSDKFSKEGQPARTAFYDVLRASPRFGICP